jgi:hypothetical protein
LRRPVAIDDWLPASVIRLNVRFGSLAAATTQTLGVCFTLESGRDNRRAPRLLWARGRYRTDGSMTSIRAGKALHFVTSELLSEGHCGSYVVPSLAGERLRLQWQGVIL